MSTQLLQALCARFGGDRIESVADDDALDTDQLLPQWAEYVAVPSIEPESLEDDAGG